MLWMLLKLLTSLACIPCASGTGKKFHFCYPSHSMVKVYLALSFVRSVYWTHLHVSIAYFWSVPFLLDVKIYEYEYCPFFFSLGYGIANVALIQSTWGAVICDWTEFLSPLCSMYFVSNIANVTVAFWNLTYICMLVLTQIIPWDAGTSRALVLHLVKGCTRGLIGFPTTSPTR
jgi:hypothetical protein